MTTEKSIIDRIGKAPWKYEFFQAVRLIERAYVEHARRENAGQRDFAPPASVGNDEIPDREAVRFSTTASLTYFGSEVAELRDRQTPTTDAKGNNRDAGAGSWLQPEMIVTFFGLTGPAGVLPRHYTTALVQQAREKDPATAEFFDLFNHRLISLFYRAWEKYRFPIGFERARAQEGGRQDNFTAALLSLAGFGTEKLSNRMAVDDDALAYFAGHLSHRPRCATSLATMLAEYFDFAVQVIQYRGQWLPLAVENRSCMPVGRGMGLNHCLGVDTVLGESVWDVSGRFRIRLGPLQYKQYLRLLPDGRDHHAILHLVRAYVGAEFDFDVQPVLAAVEVPQFHLNSNATAPSRLGWNAWLTSTGFMNEFEEVTFESVLTG